MPKQLFLVLTLCMVVQPAFAEWRMIGTPHYGLPILPPTPQAPPKPAPEVVYESDFRIAEGVLYNVRLSKRWAQFIPGAEMTVIKVLPDGVVFRLYANINETSRTSGNIGRSSFGSRTIHTSVVQAGTCFVRNFPSRALTVGEWCSTPLYVLCVEPVAYDGQMLPAYDYGVPNTPQNRKRFLNQPAFTTSPTKATNAVEKLP